MPPYTLHPTPYTLHPNLFLKVDNVLRRKALKEKYDTKSWWKKKKVLL